MNQFNDTFTYTKSFRNQYFSANQKKEEKREDYYAIYRRIGKYRPCLEPIILQDSLPCPLRKKKIIISHNLKTVCKTQIVYCSLKFCLIFFLDIEIGSLSSIIYSVYSKYKLCLNQNLHLL